MVVVVETNQQGFRLVAYWVTVIAFGLAWSWYIFDAFEKGRVNYLEKIGTALIPKSLEKPGDEEHSHGVWETYTHVILVMCPLFAVTLASLFITSTPLPVYRSNWVNKTFSFFRNFKISDAEEGNRIAKENQFLKGAGQLNFNWVAICFIVIPCVVVNLVGYSAVALQTDYITEAERWWHSSLDGPVQFV